MSLSGIIDTAHDWAAVYLKDAFPAERWLNINNQPQTTYSLAQKSHDIFNNVVDVSGTVIFN
jgi:hypothetical protein